MLEYWGGGQVFQRGFATVVLRGVLARWGAGEQKHGSGPGDWEIEEMEAWEKGGRKGASVAVAHIVNCKWCNRQQRRGNDGSARSR